MNEYDEALQQMGQAPPEHGENLGPKRRRGQRGPGKRPALVHRSAKIAPDLLPLIEGHALARGQSFNASVNELLSEALNVTAA
jgi:hypothetical protein